jgi:hypothetical protein
MVLKRRADRNGQVGGFDQTLTRAISIEPLLGLRCGVGQAGGHRGMLSGLMV